MRLLPATLRPIGFLRSIVQDLRFTLRSIGREPVFFMVLVLTLTLGIGLNTTIMTAVDAILLRPPPLRNASRLQEIWVRDADGVGRIVGSQMWERLRERPGLWEGIGAYGPATVEYAGADEASIIDATTISPGFFHLIGSGPIRGRDFLPEDFRPGSPPVVIVSDRFWKLHLGRRPDVIGQPVTLNGVATTIIGVMTSVDTANPAIDGHRKTGHHGHTTETGERSTASTRRGASRFGSWSASCGVHT